MRAGTPIGILIKRAYQYLFNEDIPHFSISIIRDKGIDFNALNHIGEKHPEKEIFFVDGWVGKGAIKSELDSTLAEYNQLYGRSLKSNFVVVSDLHGVADIQATYDDYLIPSAILNSIVSGLLSRSILNESVQKSDYHGAILYKHLKSYDISRQFIETISEHFRTAEPSDSPCRDYALITERHEYLDRMQCAFSLDGLQHIKPGVGEATRVLLRRVPECVIINEECAETEHLHYLANERNVDIILDEHCPYKAVSIIRKVL
ncbi:MAG: hypothetical protein JKY54_07415 [Flavobacteriales bacterium]|nr:hypothetical protein [Flavobacteriales bacterium]